MSGAVKKPSFPQQGDEGELSGPVNDSDQLAEERATHRPAHFFGRPDANEKPLGLKHMILILMASHIGVRSRANREEDFRRANGLHVFIAGVIYFLLVVGVLILTVNIVSS